MPVTDPNDLPKVAGQSVNPLNDMQLQQQRIFMQMMQHNQMLSRMSGSTNGGNLPQGAPNPAYMAQLAAMNPMYAAALNQ